MSNRELMDKLRRNPRGVMFELEHECADALEKAEADEQGLLADIERLGIECDAAMAELAAIKVEQPSAISDETVRVPREPTDAMLQAALAWREFAESQPCAITIYGVKLQYRSVYRAMLAAAQEDA